MIVADQMVNNASIVTRIDVYGRSILVCGDVERNAWEQILSSNWWSKLQWKDLLKNIDILVAPHHGHESGYFSELLNLAKPSMVLASCPRKDPSVAKAYSKHPEIRGCSIGGVERKLLTTRKDGHIKAIIKDESFFGKGTISWVLGEAALR